MRREEQRVKSERAESSAKEPNERASYAVGESETEREREGEQPQCYFRAL